MILRPLLLSLAAAAIAFSLAACSTNKTQRVPTVSGPAATTSEKPQRDVVKDIGNGAWNVVTAPARLVTPPKRDKKDPEVYETPSAVFTKRNYGDEDIPAAPASGPATAPGKQP